MFFAIVSCSPENYTCEIGAVCAGQPAHARLSYSPKLIEIGQTFELDASASVYDDIRWFADGVPIGACRGSDSCFQIREVPGTYEFSIKVKVQAKLFWGIQETKDKTVRKVRVLRSTSCDAPFNVTGNGFFHSSNENGCLIIEFEDRRSCRAPDYTECVTPEEAQTVCDGGWRLPSENEWNNMESSFKFISFFDLAGSATNNFCVESSGECESDGTHHPHRYITASTYPDNKGVGTLTESALGQITPLPTYDGIIVSSSLTDSYSVRCVQRFPFD